jgi:uncharacterized protein YjbI with pentapeptide repeats
MGFLANLFGSQKPTPFVIIRDRLGREIHRIEGARDLVGANLKDLNLAHADLAGESLFGANCEGTIFVGARLDRADFSKANLRRADLYLCSALGTRFRQTDMRSASLYKADIGSKKKPYADFHEALVDETTDIPGRKYSGTMRVIA